MGLFDLFRRKRKERYEEDAGLPGAFEEELPTQDYYVPPTFMPPPQERPAEPHEAPMSKDMQLIAAKLDVVMARLEQLTHRLELLEERLKGQRRW